MKRVCTQCQRPFEPADLAREESKGMESERKAAGLDGVRFLYYRCPACGTDDIFVDVLPRAGETAHDFYQRRAAMEEAVRHIHSDRAAAVVVTVKTPE